MFGWLKKKSYIPKVKAVTKAKSPIFLRTTKIDKSEKISGRWRRRIFDRGGDGANVRKRYGAIVLESYVSKRLSLVDSFSLSAAKCAQFMYRNSWIIEPRGLIKLSYNMPCKSFNRHDKL